uniref:Uncharacterized protein n=1 Tax=Ciona intestinalis TaxID=7719 RepID=H2XPP4_CIOIN
MIETSSSASDGMSLSSDFLEDLIRPSSYFSDGGSETFLVQYRTNTSSTFSVQPLHKIPVRNMAAIGGEM